MLKVKECLARGEVVGILADRVFGGERAQGNPIPVEVQAAVLWAVQNNFFDDVAVEKVKDFQTKLVDFLNTRKADVLTKIRTEKAINDALAALLKAAVTEFKQTYR